MNRVTLAVSLAALLGAFGAGWYVNGQRLENKLVREQNATLKKDTEFANKQIGVINTKLAEVVTKSQSAADTTQAALDSIATIRRESNQAQEKLTSNTTRISNEIAKLGLPKCDFNVTNGVLWQQAGKAANSGRHALYGTEGKPKD
jgi:hypothetical protein